MKPLSCPVRLTLLAAIWNTFRMGVTIKMAIRMTLGAIQRYIDVEQQALLGGDVRELLDSLQSRIAG